MRSESFVLLLVLAGILAFAWQSASDCGKAHRVALALDIGRDSAND